MDILNSKNGSAMLEKTRHVCCLIALVSATVQAQDAPDWERHYDSMFTHDVIVVDGVGNELAWQLAPEVGSFTRFQDESLRPQYQTMAKMLWVRAPTIKHEV